MHRLSFRTMAPFLAGALFAADAKGRCLGAVTAQLNNQAGWTRAAANWRRGLSPESCSRTKRPVS